MNFRQAVIRLAEEISINELPIYSSAVIAKIESVIQSAILAEREACAVMVEQCFCDHRVEFKGCPGCDLAAQIRARSNPTPENAPESPKITFAGI